MQEFQPMPGVPDHIFTGGGGSGGEDLRQLRVFPPAAAVGQQAPVKCPRCDSTNTKFCYYNNYNLSQPRHFCKSCRRYWTKGGVLRNVPVGGGCRKAKRSSSSSSSAASKNSKSSSAAAGQKDRRRPPPASRSSSESSGLSAADVSSSACASASASAALPGPGNPDANLSVDPPRVVSAEAAGQEPEIFPPAAGSFTSLMAAAAAGPAGMGFGFTDPQPFQLPAQQSPAPAVGEAEEVKIPASMDQTVPEDMRPFQPRSSGSGINGLDWPASVDTALFDLTGAMDPGAYWSQTHWGDADPSLYLP